MKCSLPPRDAIVSCFIPLGPLGMGSYAFQNLANGLSSYIQKNTFTPVSPTTSTANLNSVSQAAISETILWIGIIVGLYLIAFGTFWLIEAVASVAVNIPKHFNIGFWSFVFPMGVYANALCRLSVDVQNRGLEIYATIAVVATVTVWLGCAMGTAYRSLWRGELFFAPGLEGWNEKKAVQALSHNSTSLNRHGSSEHVDEATTYTSRSDGTYALTQRKQSPQENP